MCHLPLLLFPFFFFSTSSFLFFFPPSLVPALRPPFSSFYCSGRRRQTVANRIRGPLFTCLPSRPTSPVTLCLLLTNFGRSSSLSLSLALSPCLRLPLRHPLSLFLPPPSALPSPLINASPRPTCNPRLSDRDRVLIAAVAVDGENHAQPSRDSLDLSAVYRSLALDVYDHADCAT